MILPALIDLPPDLPTTSTPLILSLHGIGERGAGGPELERVRTWGAPRRAAAGAQPPALLVSPQCPPDLRWSPATLLTLLDEIADRWPVDPARIYLTGLSMGGTGCWDLIAAAPDRFAGAFIVCGRTDLSMAPKMIHTPLRVFHGARDPLIPVSDSVEMVAAVQAAGGQAELTIYPEAAHVEAWVAAYGVDQWWAPFNL